MASFVDITWAVSYGRLCAALNHRLLICRDMKWLSFPAAPKRYFERALAVEGRYRLSASPPPVPRLPLNGGGCRVSEMTTQLSGLC